MIITNGTRNFFRRKKKKKMASGEAWFPIIRIRPPKIDELKNNLDIGIFSWNDSVSDLPGEVWGVPFEIEAPTSPKVLRSGCGVTAVLPDKPQGVI